MKPKVSIMIPTYNQEKYISQAIKSALSQPYPNLEIIISDDCSTDNTEKVVKPFLSDKRVKYFRNVENLGRLGNYPKLLYQYANGKYVLNLDGDDFLFNTNFISESVNLLENNKNMSVVLGDRKNYYEEKDQYKTFTSKGKPFVKEIMDGNIFFLNMPKIAFNFSHFSCLYRREMALELDFYKYNNLTFDSISMSKLYIGHQVGYLQIIVGAWRSHPLNVSHKNIDEIIKSSIEKYDILYEFSLNKSIFDKTLSKDWRIHGKTSTLSQHILFYLQKGKFVSAATFIIKIFKIDTILGIKTLISMLKKIYKKLKNIDFKFWENSI